MLPALPAHLGNLRQVFPAVFGSLNGGANVFGFAPVRHAVVVMVDGLGANNLRQAKSSAPFLAARMHDAAELRAGFPSSTVASITSLATASSASEHGLFGYRIFDRSIGVECNLLSGMDKYSILNYAKIHPLSQTLDVSAVTLADYADSGFTAATMAGAKHYFAASISQRFDVALELAQTATNLTYLYVPELDQIAHSQGWQSNAWSEQLRHLDTQIERFVTALPKDVGVILIADHGVVDVPQSGHIYLDDFFDDGTLLSLGGDPRSAYLYFEEPSTTAHIRAGLVDWLGGRAYVLSIAECVEAGLFDAVLLEEDDLLPDLVVIANDGHAIYYRGISKTNSMRMIGQHGGLSDFEIDLPLIRLGAYSSSDLVP